MKVEDWAGFASADPNYTFLSAGLFGAAPMILEEGLNLNDDAHRACIVNAVLAYGQGNQWLSVEGAVLPADAALRLDLYYDNLDPQELLDNGGIVYYDLPKLLHGTATKSQLKDGSGAVIGTIQVSENRVRIIFDKTGWLSSGR